MSQPLIIPKCESISFGVLFVTFWQICKDRRQGAQTASLVNSLIFALCSLLSNLCINMKILFAPLKR